MQVQQANVLYLHFFVFGSPSGWHPDAVTCRIMILGAKCAVCFVFYCILLSVFIGWYVEYTDTWSQNKPSEKLFILVINKLEAKICFTISLLYASTCFKHHVLIVRRSKIVLYSLWYHHTYRCIIQHLVSSHL